MAKKGDVHIGTSGWHYDHWQGAFYPEDMKKSDFLEFYSKRFHTAEINNTFYQLPDKKTLVNWRDIVPKSFIFSVKASRYITHMKKLKDPRKPLSTFFKRIDALGNTLAPILFQLPPHWKCNPERLKSFLELLPDEHLYTFEFRDTSWFCDEVYDILEEHGAAFCIYELAGRLSPKQITADFIYIRLHGPGEAYEGLYGKRALAGWAGAFSAWRNKGFTVYCYFDNDQNGYAAQDAATLQTMLEK